MTIASALVAALAIDRFAGPSLYIFGYGLRFQTVVGLMLCGLGVFGALCSQKHYERNRMHVKLAQRFIAALQNKFELPFDVSAEFDAHTQQRDWRASWVEPIKLNWLWTGFPIFVALVGLVLAIGE